MTIHSFRAASKADDRAHPSPGAAPVADLRRIPARQALAIMFLRDWCGGHQSSVAKTLNHALGEAQGRVTAEAFDTLLGLIARDGRRPLYCHSLHCLCVGADEAVIANMLDLAATGAHEDAMLIASLLLSADRTLIAAEAARVAGLGILRTCIRSKTRSYADTLH